MSGKYERKKPKKKRGAGKTVVIVLVVILVIVLGLVAAAMLYARSMFGKMNQVDVPKVVYTQPATEYTENTMAATTAPTATETVETTEPPTQPHVASRDDYINVLVVGQAARDGESERFADTMILFTINTYEKSVTMTSFLRDSFVHPPDYRGKQFGRIKLTSVYHLGSYYGDGVASSMEFINMTLYSNFGVEVDYNFEVDFDAFIRIVDELGGVEIELTEAEADYLNADDFWVYKDVEPGLNKLNGMTALSYARMRKADGDNDSDITRTARQRKLVESILTKMKTRGPGFLQYVADEVMPLITTSMTTSELTQMMLTLLPMLPDLTIGEGGTCPAESWGDMVDIFGDGMIHSVLRFEEGPTKAYMRERTLGEKAAS